MQVSNLQFGPLTSGQLPLDCSVQWRKLPQGGVGINTNYLMDTSPEWRTPGGPTYVESLKVCTSVTKHAVVLSCGSCGLCLSRVESILCSCTVEQHFPTTCCRPPAMDLLKQLLS